jgi:putative transposase
MARIARVVIAGLPHHVTQRGVRRMDVFFSGGDRTEYLRNLAEQGDRFGVKYLAWCLMANHVHLVAIPEEEHSLARGIGEAHRRYTRYINFRQGWRGYLFQGRFHSFPLEGGYLLAAVRYVLRNPVRAGIAERPWDYEWSSAKWFVGDRPDDPLAIPSDMLADITDRRSFLLEEESCLPVLRRHARTGRPLGSRLFLARLEHLTGRRFLPRKPGPKPSN